MTRDELNAFCAAHPQATHVVQWGNADVYKVGGKVFAIIGMGESRASVTFKASEMAFEILSDSPGLRPAPYMASRGLKWIQHFEEPGLPDDSLRDHIRASYDMVVAKLTRKKRSDLGL
ncbi:MAG: MmcQ/YjbR family DNA-binding protein [Sulfitobacter sp.]